MRFSRPAGFTLLEVLVAVTVAGMFTIAFSQIVSISMAASRKAEMICQASRFAQESMALELLNSTTVEPDKKEISRQLNSRGWNVEIHHQPLPGCTGLEKITVTVTCPDLDRRFSLAGMKRKQAAVE
jgi:prepilin-type N-terminal cleavage/methylation domain-containing protein